MDIKGFFSGKKILVTGHTGFKGSWLTQMLLGFGSEVIGYSLAPDTQPNLFTILNLETGVKNYFEDIRDYKKVLEVMEKEKPEIVIHMAAQPLVRYSYDEPLYTFETNIMGTINVLEAMRNANCAKAGVMITTDKVYENKESGKPFVETDRIGGHEPYSASKACDEIIIDSYRKSFFAPEKYGQSHNTLIASARAGNVIGGGDWSKDRIVPDIIRAIFEKNESLVLRNPNSIRPWQHVLDPLYGYLLLARKLYYGEQFASSAWNFAPEEHNCITVEDFTKKTINILAKGNYDIKKEEASHEAKLLRLDSTKAKKQLGWKPEYEVYESIGLTMDWYKGFYEGLDPIDITKRQLKGFINKKI